MVFLASTPLQGLAPPKHDENTKCQQLCSHIPSSVSNAQTVSKPIDSIAEVRFAESVGFLQPSSSKDQLKLSSATVRHVVKRELDEQLRTRACELLSVSSASELQVNKSFYVVFWELSCSASIPFCLNPNALIHRTSLHA
jgi:hypothetical protein